MAVSGNPGGKVHVVDAEVSSHEEDIHPTTSFDENCKEIVLQTNRNYYVDSRQTCLALKLKLFKGRGYKTYNSKGVKKEHKKEAKADLETEKEQEAPVPLNTHVNNILQFFSKVEVYINNQRKLQFKWTLCAQVLHFQQLQRGHF